mmetsp:Transcript_100065/g.180529  ORF Transcript_100065/g.180529 Transcript_100065/m.180529 type:complete len:426 (+) Transcript_100065:179-1456(+)
MHSPLCPGLSWAYWSRRRGSIVRVHICPLRAPPSQQGQSESPLVMAGARQRQQRWRAHEAMVWLDLKTNDSAAHLDRHCFARLQQSRLLHGHQRPELGVIVLEHKVASLESDHSVTARDRHIGNSNIALMPSAQFQNLLAERDHVQPPRGVLLRIPHQIFQNDEGRRCLRHLDQRAPARRTADIRRIECLTKLAGQRSIKVGAYSRAASTGILSQVQTSADPVPQAAEVHKLNGALALARCNERIFLRRALQQANAAQSLREIIVPLAFWAANRPRVIQPQLWLGPRVDAELAHLKLEAAQLHDIPLCQVVPSRRTVTNNKPKLLRATAWRHLVHPEVAVFLNKTKQWLAADRHGRMLPHHLDICAVPHTNHRTQHGEGLRVEMVGLKVEEVMRVSCPRAGHNLDRMWLPRAHRYLAASVHDAFV